MLIISRKVDQVIHIGDEIQVMVTEIRGNRVFLGVTAPSNIVVHRQEVVKRIKGGEPNRRAEQANGNQ